MEEPTIVQSRRKKIPPPRPPPPTSPSLRNRSDPAPLSTPRHQTVSGDVLHRPKPPTDHAEHRGGSPALEKKSQDPVPPPRRKKHVQVSPETNFSDSVSEGFTTTQKVSSRKPAGNDREELSELRAVKQSSKRKEAQRIAKMKGDEANTGATCLNCNERCPGFLLHVWRNICINCECTRADHKIPGASLLDIPYLSRLKFGTPPAGSSPALNQLEWYPPGLTDEQVMIYMSHLPVELVPKRGSQGTVYRHRQYLLQLCDSNQVMPAGLSDKEAGRWKKFYERLMSSSSGVGMAIVHSSGDKKKVCIGCFQLVEVGDVYISAPEQLGDTSAWHPQCFKCTECQELLVDLVYFFAEQEQSIFCGRHHAELLIPRCAACDQLVFNDSYTKAKGKAWHREHFSCWACDEQLSGKSYMEENKHVYCTDCFNELFANLCTVCNKPISAGQPQVSKNNQFWHGKCYRCSRCDKELMGKTVFTKGTEMVCELCTTGGKLMACVACHERIQPTDKHLGIGNEFWHSRCFACLLCGISLVEAPFMKHHGNPFCKKCYDIQCSVRCTACDKPISAQGVKYKDKPYHSACFLCAGCDKELGGVSFITHSDQPYCKQCHANRFAQRCIVCNQSIVGKCTSYADKNYHPDCFCCANCNKVIASSTFYEDNHGKILCARCAE